MLKSLIVLLPMAIILFFIGYNCVLNTEKSIDFFDKYKSEKEKNRYYKFISKENQVIIMKVSGGVAIIIGLFLILLPILFNNNNFKNTKSISIKSPQIDAPPHSTPSATKVSNTSDEFRVTSDE